MTKRLCSFAFFSFALITSACGAAMKNPDIKSNPHPKMRYEITMTIEGAPGPFDSIDSYVKYQVMNPSCVPMRPGSGATPTLEKSVSIELTRVGDHAYKGTFYTDFLQDEDYYGMGVCQWAVVGTGAQLKVKSVVFSPDIPKSDLAAQRSEKTYFSKDSYSGATSQQDVEIGSQATPFIAQNPDKFFSVTLAATESSK